MTEQPRTMMEFARAESARAKAAWRVGEDPRERLNFSKPRTTKSLDWLQAELLKRLPTTDMNGAQLATALGVGRGQIYRAAKQLGWAVRRDGSWGRL